MKFKATKIATAVAAGLGLSVVGMSAAKADSILFPHFVLSPTVTTILSVVNDDFSALEELHYRYYYNNGQSGQCAEYDFWNPTSENDIVTFDMGAHFTTDATGVLFEPNSTTVRYIDDFAILARPAPTPTRGYVLVENTPRNPNDDFPAPTARLAGDAVVVEFITGSAWGYSAYNASEIWGYTPGRTAEAPGTLTLLNQNDFSDRVEVNGEVLTAPLATTTSVDQKNAFWVPISIMPWDQMQSALLVTAVSTNMGPNGSYAATTSLKLRGTAQGADRIMFNRDERAYSGPGAANITCIGRVEIEDMVGETVKQSTPQGGWTNLTVTNGQAIVFKAEINTSFPVDNGTFNNIYQLRKGFRESQRNVAIGVAADGRTATVTDTGLGRPVVTAGGWTYLPVYNIPGLDNNAPYVPLLGATSVPVVPGVVQNGNTVVNPEVVYSPSNFATVRQVQAAVAAGNVTVSTAQ